MKALSILKNISLLLIIVLITSSISIAQTAKQSKNTEIASSTQKMISGDTQVELKVFPGKYEVRLFESNGTQRKALPNYTGVIGFMYDNGNSAEFDMTLQGDKLVFTAKDNLKVMKIRMKITGGQEDIFAGFEIQ